MAWVDEDPRRWRWHGGEDVEDGATLGKVHTLAEVRITNRDPERSASISIHMYPRRGGERGGRVRLDAVRTSADDLRMPVNLSPGESASGDISYYEPLKSDLYEPEEIVAREYDVADNISGRSLNLDPILGIHRLIPAQARPARGPD